ncbi:uncharacterized protein LOC128548234 [Mercenaria mercenaria]|uniref:uncharacterized protein LOC128548234 n=1 Tax=Mercenaria mercenaria TaxID=6596 RepID=UPI00234E6548|nr:uncharacterized protein LOC128548234 [Mercenaria mercenaria]
MASPKVKDSSNGITKRQGKNSAERYFFLLKITCYDISSIRRNLNGDEDEPMSTTVLEDPTEILYTVVEEGTLQKGKKLVSSDGFAYLVKRRTARAVQWRCNQRRKGNICYASVRQEGDVFSPGTMAHNHPADPLMRQKVELRRDVSIHT